MGAFNLLDSVIQIGQAILSDHLIDLFLAATQNFRLQMEPLQ